MGVRREGGGNGEVRRGRRGVQVKTDNTQGTKLLTCRVWTTSAHSPHDANLRVSGQVSQRIVPSCTMARPSQWQETVGCRAVPLASFTSTKVTDHIWNWCHVHGFLKVLRIGGSQGEGRIHRRGTQPHETHTGQFRTAWARQPICVYFQLKVFSFVNHQFFFLRKATQSNRLQDTICVHFDSSSCHKTPSCTVIIQNAKNKVLLVTQVKMKLTAQRNTKQKEISVWIQRDAWQYYPPKKCSQIIVLACCSSLPQLYKFLALWRKVRVYSLQRNSFYMYAGQQKKQCKLGTKTAQIATESKESDLTESSESDLVCWKRIWTVILVQEGQGRITEVLIRKK